MDPSPGEFESFSQSLATRCLGRDFRYLAETDSTNTRAMVQARQGAPEGCLVLADSQSAGRGRLGRRWISPAGSSLLFSLVLRPPLPLSAAPQITLMLSVALCRALRQSCGLPAEIKWPNDVLVRGRKVCGILVEMEGQPDRLDFLVAGVGLNVFQREADFPAELRDAASSLRREGGEDLSRPALLRAILEETERAYDQLLQKGFQPILGEWQRLSAMTGRQVRVQTRGGQMEGMALGLDPDGALQLRLDNGVIERLLAGDVTLLRPNS